MMTPRNLVFIFSDQHAQRVAGCYGDRIVRTPNIDRLAKEGVTFDNAYCPSPLCVPSRMATLTARWPFRQECWTNEDMLRSDVPTWLHSLGTTGRRPVLIGRLDAIGPDQLHGYVDRPIGEHSPNWPGIQWGKSLGILEGTNEPDAISLARAGSGMGIYQLKDQEVTKAAIDWIKTKGREQAKNPGFCLTVGYMLPHPPYVADAEAYARYQGAVPPPRLAPPSGGEHPFLNWWREQRGIDSVPAEFTMRARAAYWALVDRADEMIGRVLDTLEETGLLDETLVIYTSDHGDHLGERGLWWKHTFHEESVKVPLVMRLPGVLPSGERRAQVVNLVDLTQTILEAMDAPTLPSADGRSFWAVAQDGNTPWLNETFSEYCTDPVPAWTGGRAVQQRMLRAGPWKLIVYDAEPVQLFNLEEDPDELNDLGGDLRHAHLRDGLIARIRAGWDSANIRRRMGERRVDTDLIGAWARRVQPPGQFMWKFQPDQNQLDDPEA